MGKIPFSLFRRFAPKTLETELLPGIRASLDTQDLTQLCTWWQGDRFERPTGDILKSWLREGPSVFFDIGSNYGFYSYLVLSTQPGTPTHAFEPHPRTFARLKAIRDRNSLESLSCWNMALGDRAGELPLHPGTEDLGQSTFALEPKFQDNQVISVPVRVFGEWRREQGIPLPPHPQWIAKIDVEGYELRVLQGMREELKARSFRGLIVESNMHTLKLCGATPDDIVAFLDEAGYRVLIRTPQSPDLICNVLFVPKD